MEVKSLRLATRALIAATIVLLAISSYSLVAFLGGMISPESGIGLSLDQTPSTGDYVLNLSLNPINRGFLGVDLSTKLTILDAGDRVVESNSTLISIPPGQSRSSAISLTIPKSMVPDGNIENVKASIQVELDVRTLWNLVGFKNILKAGSGME